MSCFSKFLAVVSICSLCALLACQGPDELSELTEQSPFKNRSGRAAKLTIITCECHIIQLPADFDLSALDFWSHYGIGDERQEVSLPAEQLRTWRTNGFELSAAPLNDWPQLQQSLASARGRSLPRRTAIFRNDLEIAEFNSIFRPEPATVFVHAPGVTPRGCRLSGGDYVFRVICTSRSAGTGQSYIDMQVVPVFKSAEQRLTYRTNDRHVTDHDFRVEQVVESPEVIFDRLILDAALPEGYFLCIASGRDKTDEVNLGRLFLGRDIGEGDFQLLLVLVPGKTTARRVEGASS